MQLQTFEDRAYQTNAVDSIFKYFENGGKGNPLVCMPTGTGKSLVIARFIERLFKTYPTSRVMMLTHVKKLIEQNAHKLMQVWPTAPLGIYSAGLNSRDMILPIVFGGVQSVAPAIKKTLQQNNDLIPPNLLHFGWRAVLLIDEAHLLSPSEITQYQYVISELKKINPFLNVIGFTATPYRLGQGLLTDNGLFTDICFDITDINSFNRLIAEGYLCNVVSRPTETRIDVQKVKLSSNGDYNAKEVHKACNDDTMYKAICEAVSNSYGRTSWITFACDIDRAELANAMLTSLGVNSTVVHSKIKSTENDKRIKAYQNFEYQCIVNSDMLTTGFDHPAMDFGIDLAPTVSTGKHVQKIGRLTRTSTATNKINALWFDFAGNLPRLGPINDPKIPRKPGEKTGEVPIKICPECFIYNHASARYCGGKPHVTENGCGFEFDFTTKLFAMPSTATVVKCDEPIVEYMQVSMVIYNLHQKDGSPLSLKVTYICGLRQFSEWICLEHGGAAAKRARDWWRARHHEEPPILTIEAHKRANELRKPQYIRVRLDTAHPQIMSHEF